jgi:uncharacterized membrane protein YeaQ/YmgE (transglycosylase-associated protein family)
MGIISATFIGLIVGTIAKFLMPGGSGGWIITILFVRDVPMNEPAMPITVDLPRMGEPADFIGSTVGATILLLFYRLVFKPRAWSARAIA